MINITFTADPLPSDFRGTLQDFQNNFLLNLRGSISETQVLTGQIGGAMPTTNVGPWLNNDTWYIWNGSTYVPTTIKIGNPNNLITLVNTPVSSPASPSTAPTTYTQVLQDKSGTIALLTDVYQGRPAVVLSGTNVTIDWNQGHHFYQTLSGNTTIKTTNSVDGQKIVVALRNNSTSYTVTWPTTPTIFWTTGTPPTQTPNKTDLYFLRNIGGSIFGRQVPNY